MAIHWQVKFRSLRSDTLYTVNIYDDDYGYGEPLQLKGSARPFTTDEDSDDNIFATVRTQSGYLRIVDDGTALTQVGYEVPFDWRDFIPATDTSRPVTLTNEQGAVLWCGFLQAQNFGSQMHLFPQQREFPLQCPLTVVSRDDVDYDTTSISNFAHLLKVIVDSIPAVCRPAQFVFQGTGSMSWLQKKIDWQNFCMVTHYGLEPRFNLFECLGHLCQFWGWTARVSGQTLFFVSPDVEDDSLYTLTYQQLTAMSSGSTPTPSTSEYSVFSLPSDVFASVANTDYQMRGPNKAVFSPDINEADEYIFSPLDKDFVKKASGYDWLDGYLVVHNNTVHYTKDVLSLSNYFHTAVAVSGRASFNIISVNKNADGYQNIGNVISIKESYDGNPFVTMQTIYQHDYSNGFFTIEGTVYRDGEKFEDRSHDSFAGDCDMKAILVVISPSGKMYWDGEKWVSSVTDVEFRITIGNRDEEMYTRYWATIPTPTATETNIISTPGSLNGILVLRLLGSDYSALPDIGGKKIFDIKDFKVKFWKNNTVSKVQYPNSGWYEIQEDDIDTNYEYMAENHANIHNEMSVDSVFATSGIMRPAYGVLLNPDGTPFVGHDYGDGVLTAPEQRFVDRVAGYWSTSKRKMECELRADKSIGSQKTVAALSPDMAGHVDGTYVNPVSISHEWRDDIVRVVFVEI